MKWYPGLEYAKDQSIVPSQLSMLKFYCGVWAVKPGITHRNEMVSHSASYNLCVSCVVLFLLDLPEGMWDNLTISTPPSPQIFCPSENSMLIITSTILVQINSPHHVIPGLVQTVITFVLNWIVHSQTHHCIESACQLPLENCITYSWNASRKVTY